MNKNNQIKAARVLSGYTQAQLAKKLGKPQSWVSSIENGGLGDARLIDVLRLCKILGISIVEVEKIVM